MIPAKPEAFRLLMEGSAAFADVEENGMKIDVPYLHRAISETKEKIRELDEKMRQDEVFRVWRKLFGSESDFMKDQQLARVLYSEMNLPCSSYTKTGRPSTDEESFENIDLPFVKWWTDYKKLNRLLTTDLVGTLKQTDDQGVLHPFFHLNFASTYRSSSSDPNFHNKPNRDRRLAEIIRTAFIPRNEEFVLIEADYGALEFRGAACFWKDPGMISFASDPSKDIHRDMATECYSLSKNQVTKATRGEAKNKFVFPTLYGSYWKNTGRDLWNAIGKSKLTTVEGESLYDHLSSIGISGQDQFTQHIKSVEESFNDRFSHWSKSKDAWWKDYLRNGEFPLMTGFVCRGVYSYNNLMNTPIQGPSFHLMLWSLTRINEYLKKKKMRSMVIGQIHDSISIDACRAELQEVLDLLDDVMTNQVRRHWSWVVTPLEVEVDVAETNWFEKKPWVKKGGAWAPKA